MFNTLKKLSLATLVVSTAFIQVACNDKSVEPDKVGNWFKSGIPSFGGSQRTGAVSFVIGDKGYIGTGLTNESTPRVQDFWSYDAAKFIWTQVAPFGGTGRNNAVAFVVGGKAYVGTGFDGNSNPDLAYKKDFWQYDPATNKWKAVADFLGGTRQYSSAFVVNDKAYVGLGVNQSNYFQDFYSYDPAADKWTEIATFTGGKRRGASAFTVGGKAYVGFGTNNSTQKTKDLYQFDPATGAWSRVVYTQDDLSVRTNALSLVIAEKAYIIGGEGMSDVWEFDAAKTEWTQKNPFPTPRGYSAGFVVGTRGYVGTGSASSTLTDDFWAFDPNAALDEDDDL